MQNQVAPSHTNVSTGGVEMASLTTQSCENTWTCTTILQKKTLVQNNYIIEPHPLKTIAPPEKLRHMCRLCKLWFTKKSALSKHQNTCSYIHECPQFGVILLPPAKALSTRAGFIRLKG